MSAAQAILEKAVNFFQPTGCTAVVNKLTKCLEKGDVLLSAMNDIVMLLLFNITWVLASLSVPPLLKCI